MKVCVLSEDHLYKKMFLVRGHQIVEKAIDADLVQFTGGADVSPSLYNQLPHPKTVHVNPDRDKAEQIIFQYCLSNNIPMAGICRGGQFLNVMNKGGLYQHVDGHQLPHEIYDMMIGKTFKVTSTHHQMMRPGPKCRVVASCKWVSKQREYMCGKVPVVLKDSSTDYEVLFYENSNSLCFQPHPEIKDGECQDYYFFLIKKFFGLGA